MIDLDLLGSIPVFAFFTRHELEAAVPLFHEVTYAKDDVVVRIGEPGDTFYVVLEGEADVWDASEPPRQTGTLRAGDYFGEQALLQGGKRTATVMVARRARMLAVDKPTFDKLFLTNPKAIEYFARVLSKRLASVTRAEAIRRATTTIAVASSGALKGETLVAFSLAALLKKLTNTEVAYIAVSPAEAATEPMEVDLLSEDVTNALRKVSAGGQLLPAVLNVSLRQDRPQAEYAENVSKLVSLLSESFSFIVLDLGSQHPALVASVPAYSDVFVPIVNDVADPIGVEDLRSTKVHRVINLFNPTSQPIPISNGTPFVIPYSAALQGSSIEAAGYILNNPRSGPGLPLHRLARKLLGTSIGLALGGGAAFGLAHLGVLKVLEDEGIEVDVVAGCSQGSIVAVGYAAGLGVGEMIEIARELGAKKNFFFASDPTFLTKPGILSGQRFLTMLRPYLRGKETFEQLMIPCQTVATDIQTGERVTIGSGSLEIAFRASSSVPMVMAPVKYGERVLVDGGVADPVPAQVVIGMGADITVAVNVVPPMKRGVETAMAYWYRRLSVLNPLSYIAPETQDMPNLFDIVMNAMQILQYELGNFKAITADVLINPDLSDFTWIEYYRADELIERGAQAARRALPQIRKAIDGKIRPIQLSAPGRPQQ
ncbi:MAG: patatin-like phospholipase family protein [Vicinamibacterales bacterium]